jgi:hypothetical protein
VHGLSEHKLATLGATDLCTAFKPFLAAIASMDDEVCLIAHNGYSFDSRFVAAGLRAHSLEMPPNFAGWFDTMKTTWGAGKLDDVAKRLGVPIKRSMHGALVDARLLAEVFEAGFFDKDIDIKQLAAFEPVGAWLKRTESLPCPPLVAGGSGATVVVGAKRAFDAYF